MARNISWAKIWEAERLDITLWSDDSPVSNAVNALAKELKRVVTFKRMTWQRKKAIRIVILNLYLRWLEDPPGLVSYSRNKSNYTIPARYNPAQIGYGPIISVIDGLWKLGYIDKTTNGYYARFGGKSWISRMAPKPKLIRLLEKTYGVDGSMIGVHSKAETIILRDADKKEVDYSNRRYIDAWRNLLKDYNNLLRRKYIDIDLNGYPDPKRINLGKKFVRRIFNNRSFEQGGRFYGGWWQLIPKDLRPRILIRSKPTVELDFSGIQIVLVYAECGIDYFSTPKGDPYSLPGYANTDRDVVKKATLIALNADTKHSAQGALYESIKDGDCQLPQGKTIKDIFGDIEAHHIDIKSQLYVGRAGYYQYLDSQVVEKVLRYFTYTERDPVLCIHDSFIVDEAWKSTLEQKMVEALSEVIVTRTLLNSITPNVKGPLVWRSPPATYPYDLEDIARSPDVQRQQDWFRTKRQGVLIYQPPSP